MMLLGDFNARVGSGERVGNNPSSTADGKLLRLLHVIIMNVLRYSRHYIALQERRNRVVGAYSY